MNIDLPIGDLEKLVEFQFYIRDIAKDKIEPLTPDQMNELIKYAEHCMQGPNFNLLHHKAYGGACGCMGPDYGYTICPCRLSGMLEVHKFEVALEIKRRESA